MKFIGIVLIVVSAGSVGFRMAISLKQQTREYTQLLQSLQLMRNEIAFCGTPLPQTFAVLAASCQGRTGQFYEAVAKTMDKYPWMTPVEAVQQQQKLLHGGFPVTVFSELAVGLGKYDLDSQLQAIAAAKDRVKLVLEQLEQERRGKTKLYETLGICAGLSLAILLS